MDRQRTKNPSEQDRRNMRIHALMLRARRRHPVLAKRLREALILENLGLAYHYVNENPAQWKKLMDREEADAIVTEALIKSVDTWKPHRGALSVRLSWLARSYLGNSWCQLEDRPGRTNRRYIRHRYGCQHIRWTDMRVTDDGKPYSVFETLPEEIAEHGYRVVEARAALEPLLTVLNDRQREAVLRYFADPDTTFDDVAPTMGVSRQRVAQIVDVALKKMRLAAGEEAA